VKEKGRNPLIKRASCLNQNPNYNLLFPALFALAHLAFANATNLVLPAAVNFLLGF